MISKNTFKVLFLLIFSLLAACTDSDNKNTRANTKIIDQSPSENEITLTNTQTNKDEGILDEVEPKLIKTKIIDSTIHKILSTEGLEKKYQISYSHDPYKITGLFNNDDILDTAFIVKNNDNNKEGLIIKYGFSDLYELTIFGAGKKVLNQAFDDFIWVGEFKTIPKGSKAASNVGEDGEIITEVIPDSLKTILPNDGIFIHASESCGGGIIYSDNESYQWIQQE